WTGKVVIKPAVEGWFVQWQFLVSSNGKNRENRWMVTYDPKTTRYRIWRFETAPLLPNPEGEALWDGGKFITRWDFINRKGAKGIYQNTLWINSAGELEGKSEFDEHGKRAFIIEEFKCRRL